MDGNSPPLGVAAFSDKAHRIANVPPSPGDPSGAQLVGAPGVPPYVIAPTPLLDRLADVAVRVGAHYAHVLGLHNGSSEFLLRAQVGDMAPSLPVELSDREIALAAHTIRFGIPTIVADAHSDPLFRKLGLVAGKPYRSGMALPVWGDGFPLGAVVFYGHRPGMFTTDQLDAVSDLARLAADVFRSEDSSRALWREAEIRGVLLEIGRVLNSSAPGDDVCRHLADRIQLLVPLDRMSICLLDGARSEVTLVHVVGVQIETRPAGSVVPVGQTVVGEMLRLDSGLRYSTAELRAASGAVPTLIGFRTTGLKSLVNAPLRSQGEIVGSLNLASRQEDAYTEEHLRLLERIAREISGAIVNAGAYDQLRRRADESAILAEIARIASSRLEPHEVMEQAVGKIRQLIPFDRVGLEAIDASTQTTTRLFASGTAIPGQSVGDHRFIGMITQKTLFRREAVIRSEGEVYADDGPAPFHDDRAATVGLKSVLAVPLIARGEPVGSLAFRSRYKSAYGPREAALAARIAQPIAGLMDNARVRQELEREAQHRDFIEQIRTRLSSAETLPGMLTDALTLVAAAIPIDQIAALMLQPRGDDLLLIVPDLDDSRREVSQARCESPFARYSEEALVGEWSLASLLAGYERPTRGAGTTVRRDEQGHYWLLFPIETDTMLVGRLALHWTSDAVTLNRRARLVQRVAGAVGHAVADRHSMERLGASTNQLEATQAVLEEVARRQSVESLTDAFRRTIQLQMHARLLCIYTTIRGEPASESVLFHTRGREEREEEEESELGMVERARWLIDGTLGSEDFDDEIAVCGWRARWCNAREPRDDLERDSEGAQIVVQMDRGGGSEIGAYLAVRRDSLDPWTSRSLGTVVAAWLRALSAAIRPTDIDVGPVPSATAPGSKPRPTEHFDGLRVRLSEKDRTILLKLTEGLSNEEIGAFLHLAPGTVKNRLGAIYRRLGVTSRAGAIAVAVRAGLFSNLIQ